MISKRSWCHVFLFMCISLVVFAGILVPSEEIFTTRPVTLQLATSSVTEVITVRYVSFSTKDAAMAYAHNYNRVEKSFGTAIKSGPGRYVVQARVMNVRSPFGRVLKAWTYKWLTVRIELADRKPVTKVLSVLGPTGDLMTEISISVTQ